MSQGGYVEHNPDATNDANIADGGNEGMTEVGTPHATTAEATHGVAGQQRSAADAALAQEPFEEASETVKKKADGEEVEEFDIASPADNPEIELEAKQAAMIKAQEELEEAERKAQARKDKEDKDDTRKTSQHHPRPLSLIPSCPPL